MVKKYDLAGNPVKLNQRKPSFKRTAGPASAAPVIETTSHPQGNFKKTSGKAKTKSDLMSLAIAFASIKVKKSRK